MGGGGGGVFKGGGLGVSLPGVATVFYPYIKLELPNLKHFQMIPIKAIKKSSVDVEYRPTCMQAYLYISLSVYRPTCISSYSIRSYQFYITVFY